MRRREEMMVGSWLLKEKRRRREGYAVFPSWILRDVCNWHEGDGCRHRKTPGIGDAEESISSGAGDVSPKLGGR